MTYEAKLMSGITLLTIPTIEYGGYFLLTVLTGKFQKMEFTGFQKSMFRAGHAHAGVIVILSLICQLMADDATLPVGLNWLVRAGVPTAALLISGGFFACALNKGATKPNGLIKLIYVGIFVLALSLIILGIGLLR
ncbi:hypothetical protein [Chryseolinea lacunae]|uniref:Uncharacterized protein n=1 Tax=Chryseolinea lacunae TaxID=2801331 RepID=A0ABS1KZX6_9BACT|nr:hypothetical protein [Chryseolinea lacunae]MBL0743871.1 hypothetical protein [Chryseolinea lacunae]